MDRNVDLSLNIGSLTKALPSMRVALWNDEDLKNTK